MEMGWTVPQRNNPNYNYANRVGSENKMVQNCSFLLTTKTVAIESHDEKRMKISLLNKGKFKMFIKCSYWEKRAFNGSEQAAIIRRYLWESHMDFINSILHYNGISEAPRKEDYEKWRCRLGQQYEKEQFCWEDKMTIRF